MNHLKLKEEEEKLPYSSETQLDNQRTTKSENSLYPSSRATPFLTIKQEISALKNLKKHFIACSVLSIIAFLVLIYQVFKKPGMNFMLALIYLLTAVIYLYGFIRSWNLEYQITDSSEECRGFGIDSLYRYINISIYSLFLIVVPLHTVITIFGTGGESVFREYMDIQTQWISFCTVGVSLFIVLDTMINLRCICYLGIHKETMATLGINYGLGVLNISLVGLYYLLTVWNYWDEYSIQQIFDVKEKPVYVVVSSIGYISVILLSLYLFTRKEPRVMKYSCLVYFIVGALGLIPALYFTYTTYHTDSSFEDNCIHVIQSVDQHYLQNLYCRKYSDTAESDNILSCPKYLITYIWEERSYDSYGCLNMKCCDVFKKDVVFKVCLLNSCFISTCLLIIASSILLWYNAKLLSRYEYGRIRTQNMPLIILVLILISFSGMFASLLPSISSSFDPHSSLKTVVYNIGYVNSFYIEQEYCGSFDTLKFSSCSETIEQYSYLEVEFDTAYLNAKLTTRIKPKYIKKDDSQLQIYRFKNCRDFDDIKNDMEVCSPCPLDKHAVNYQIKGYNDDQNKGDLIYSNVRHAKLTGKYSIHIDRKTYTSELSSEKNGIEDVQFIGTMEGCEHSLSGKSLQHGQFYLGIPLPNSLSPFLYNLKFSKEGYYDSDIVAHLGGIPLGYNTFPNVPMIPITNSTSGYQIYGQVNHMILQSPVSDAVVELRLGYNNYTGPAYSQFITNSTGWFEFINLTPGLYTLKGYKSGFFHDIREVILNEEMVRSGLMISEQDITKDNIRISLTWRSNIDLDIHARFKLTTSYTCDVNFSARKCGGTVLEAISSDGYLAGESILVKHGSVSDYLFYVKAFDKQQDGNDSGGILSSEAIVSVYIMQKKEPVVRLRIPIEYNWKDKDPEMKIWTVFCISGVNGVESLLPAQIFLPSTDTEVINTLCSNLYETILNGDT